MAEPSSKRLKMATLLPQSESNSLYAYSLDKADCVTLIVGPDKHELLVHANILTRKSEVFRTAVKKEWREGQTCTITLRGDDSQIIAAYLRFLYRDRLPAGPEAPQTFIPSLSYKFYTKMYVLGGRLIDETVKREAIKKMHGMFKCGNWFLDKDSQDEPGHEFVNTIYNDTTESDPARRLLVDMHVECPRDLTSEYHPEFLLALAQAFSRRVRTSPLPGNKVLEVDSYLS